MGSDKQYVNTLWQCMPHDLDHDEIGYYYAAVDTDEHSGGVEVVSRLINDGLMELWVWNDGETILVTITRIVDYPDGYRELLVAMMAGTNVTATMTHEEVQGALMNYAQRHMCSRMVAYMKPEIWGALKDRLGYHHEYEVVSLYPDDLK
jgi:hypothetical protein